MIFLARIKGASSGLEMTSIVIVLFHSAKVMLTNSVKPSNHDGVTGGGSPVSLRYSLMLEFLVILLYWASAAVMAFIAEFLTTFVAPVVKVSKAKLKNSIAWPVV